MSRPDFAAFDAELWLAGRLKEHGAQAFEGVTSTNSRRETFRETILRNGLSQVIAGTGKDGKPKTYAQAFEAVYGQKLELGSHG